MIGPAQRWRPVGAIVAVLALWPGSIDVVVPPRVPVASGMPEATESSPRRSPPHASHSPRVRDAADAADRLRPAPTAALATLPAPRWSVLLAAADGGDPQAACRLALLLDDCRLADDVQHMIETQISVAAADARPAAEAAREIAALETSVAPLQALCRELPAELDTRAAGLLLQAAIAGHEPSALRYLTDPPLPRSAARGDAVREYGEHAADLLDAMLQRASPPALALGWRAAQGEAFVPGVPVSARDPQAMLRLGTALLALRDADEGIEALLDQVARSLAPARALQAQREGRDLAARVHAAAQPVSSATRGDDCSVGWPGMRSAWMAYTY